MGKIYFLFIFLLLHLLSCEKTTITEIEEQVVTLSEDTLFIREGQYKTLSLSLNVGQVRYEINNSVSWLNVSSFDGFITADQSLTLTLSVNTILNNYPASTTLMIKTGEETFNIYVAGLPENPEFVSPKEIQLNPQLSTAEIFITNPEIEKFGWKLSALPVFMKSDRISGELAPGSFAKLQLTLDTSAIGVDFDTTFTIHITLNQQKEENITINIQNFRPGLRLETDVIDGVYSAINQKYFYITSKPKGISFIDMKTLEKTFVPFSFVPTCLTLSQDEKKAAIGHDARITYFDLVSMKVISEFNVDCKAIDVILAPNSYIYVFPERDQWTYLRCINTATGIQECKESYYLYAGSVGELHPTGNWIYYATTNISPNDVHKIDISQGPPEYLYDSPYHGTYNLGGYIKITANGNKILSGNVFLSSNTDKSADMLYRGTLDPDNEWQTSQITPRDVYFHPEKDEVFIAMSRYFWSDAKPEYIYRYNTISLELISKIRLIPIVTEDGNLEPAFPRNVWVLENKMYVVVHTENKEIWEIRYIPI